MKVCKLFFLFLFLSLKGFSQTTITITSSITIDQDWVDANYSASERVISGNNITVTFGQNLTITPTAGVVQTFFKIQGTNVVIDGANKIVTLAGTNVFNGLVDASADLASTAIIKNIGIEVSNPSTFQMNSSTGYISSLYNKAAIQNCYSNGRIYQPSMGGIVGRSNRGMISNCYSTGAISGTYAGGIVGGFNTVSGTIQNCYSTGAISGIGAGGIAGHSNDASIQNAYSFGSITGTDNTGTISNTYNTYIGDGTWNSTDANFALTGEDDGSVWNTTTLMPTLNSYTLYDLILTSINLTSPIATLTSCLGTASSPTTFGVTGSGLTASITISAPSNFEVSTSSGGTYSSSLTLTNTSTVSQTLYVRLNSSATAGSKTGNITATSTGVTDVTTTVSGTVNALPNISISGTTTNPELVSLTATASEGSTYAWSDGSSISSTINTFDASGLYSLTVTDANGCISITQLNITVQQYGLSSTGEKTLDSTRQISSSGQIGSLNPISQDGKTREYKKNINSSIILNLDAGNPSSYPGTGTIWYDVSGSNNGSMTNITYTASPGYFSFNGSSSKISFSSGITSGDNLTYETWVNFPSSPRGVIANSDYWSSGYVHFQFNPTLHFDLNGGGDMGSTASYSLNTWYHLVAVYSNISHKLTFYTNGVLTNTISSIPSVTISNTTFTIGAWNNGGLSGFYNGKLAIFRAYNIALDATQVQRNYNALKSRFGL